MSVYDNFTEDGRAGQINHVSNGGIRLASQTMTLDAITTTIGSSSNSLTIGKSSSTATTTILSGSGGIVLNPGAGAISLDGVSFPTADGTNGQVLSTNGAGTLSWQ